MNVDLTSLYKDFIDNGSDEQRECYDWLRKYLFRRALKSIYIRPFFQSYSKQRKIDAANDFAWDAITNGWEKRYSLKNPVAFLGWCQRILDNNIKKFVRDEGVQVVIDNDHCSDIPSARYAYIKNDIFISHIKLDEDAEYDDILDYLSGYQNLGSTQDLAVDKALEQEEIWQLVSQSSKCSKRSREVVLKRLQNEMKDKEIAEQLDMTVGSVTKEFERDIKHLHEDPNFSKWRHDYLKGN